MSGKWKCYVERTAFEQGTRVYLGLGNHDGGVDVVEPLVFRRLAEGDYIGPVSTIAPNDGEDFLRAVLNAAWEQGLRPDGFLDARESMKATNAHLQDMRAIAFHKIGAAKP